MKIKHVILENFRKYKEPTKIDIGELTAFIGKNDAGKSTVLEALDIFFENNTTKMTPEDACVSGERNRVRIGVVFDKIPEQLDIDAGALTTLQAEHLLNADGFLELHKTYDCTKSTMTPKVSTMAVHPSSDAVKGLISKKNADLKKLVKDAGVEANCHLNNNPSMRQALYDCVSELNLVLQEVQLNDGDAKNIWEAVKRHLPIYALFRSDRSSSDQDPEVQDPMKLAIRSALAENA
ncbi:MAG: AAA family ATPase, partial [Chloroflexota bacterium]